MNRFVFTDVVRDMQGWRVLDLADVLCETDETTCLSTFTSEHGDHWFPLKGEHWPDYAGHTVMWATSRDREDMDARDRIFRRRLP